MIRRIYNDIYGKQQHNMFAFPSTTDRSALLRTTRTTGSETRLRVPSKSPYFIHIQKLTPIYTSLTNRKCWKLNSEHVRPFKHNKQLAHVMQMLIVSLTNFDLTHVQIYNEQTWTNMSTFKNWYQIHNPNFGCHPKLQDVSYLLQMETNH